MTLIHLISNDQNNLEKAFLQFAEAHYIGIELHATVKDFLSAYREKHKKKKQEKLKYEDFESWLDSFHLILGCWVTKKEWKKAKRQLRTREPRIVSRIKSANREYLNGRIKNILGEKAPNLTSIEVLKKKYLKDLRGKYKTNIWRDFQFHRELYPVFKKNRKSLLIDQKLIKSADSPLKYERLRLIKMIYMISEQKRDQMDQIKYDENDLQIGDRCLEILNYNVESAAYLSFFDHCPWCRSKDIQLNFFKSPAWTWVSRFGRSGWVVECGECKELLLFDLVAMS